MKKDFKVVLTCIVALGLYALLLSIPKVRNVIVSELGLTIVMTISIVLTIIIFALSFSLTPPSLSKIWRRKPKASKEYSDKKISVEDLYVVSTHITSSYNDDSGAGPRFVELFFLARRMEEDEYFELFTGIKLEKEENTHKGEVVVKSFDTPYIQSVRPFKEYLEDENQKEVTIESLFEFITVMNVVNSLGAFDDENDEEE